MGKQIIWLHEKALSKTHLVFEHLNEHTKIIHVWDDNYYQKRGYSLKRLVFIYETLCELPAEIISGNTIEILKKLNPEEILVPYTVDIEIRKIFDELSKVIPIVIIKENAFVDVSDHYEFKRFFKYWKKASQTAFLINGIENA